MSVPLGERVTVPRHLPQAHVTTAMVMGSGVATALGTLGPVAPMFGALTRSAAPLLRRATGRLAEGPSEEQRARARFRILVQATRGPSVARVLVEGHDIYRLTAVLLVEAALRLQGRGPLAPSQAVEPAEFLDVVSGSGLLSWRYLD